MIKITKEQIKIHAPEILIAVISSVTGVLMAWYVYTQHLMITLSDQAAHLIFARLLTDSLTPGITQLGTWPPLLHILMMPAIAIRPFFDTGMAGAVTLLPIFVVGTVLLYKLTYELTKNKTLSFASAIVYIFNPYVLYYAVTPMMEVLFITIVIAVAYFFVLWLEYDRLRYLLLAGIFITLASLSRYEGLFLIPVACLIVGARLISRRTQYYEIEATGIIFGSLAVLGFAYLVIYSWVFAGHPLAFAGFNTGVNWFIGADSTLSITKGSLTKSLQYLMHASYYMIGRPLVFLSFVCAIIALFPSRDRLKKIAAMSLLFTPFLAILFALYRGSNSIHVPELFPFDRFHNDRYAISWAGFVAITPFLSISCFKKTRLTIVYTLLFVAVILFFSGSYFYNVIKVENFSVIKNNITSKRGEPSDFVKTLKFNYDFGKILAARYSNDFLYLDSGLPLKTFIYEGNYRYFDETLNLPWLYARWVIMQKPNSLSLGYAFDPIKEKWADDFKFHQYYSVVADDGDRIVYKINKIAVNQYASENDLDPDKIPSLNSSITKWNPDTIWQEMQLNQFRKMD